MPDKGCNYREDCGRPHHANGMCKMHDSRVKRKNRKVVRRCSKCPRVLRTERDTCWEHTPKEPKESEKRYVLDLIDELEIRGGTWPELTEKYERGINALSTALRREGRQDLIDKVKFATYGVIRQSDIVSVVNSQRKENA